MVTTALFIKPLDEHPKVLEINGGLANELGIRVGDTVGYFIEDN